MSSPYDEHKQHLKKAVVYIKELEEKVRKLTADNEKAFQQLQEYKLDLFRMPEYKDLERRLKEAERGEKKWRACVLAERKDEFQWEHKEEDDGNQTSYWGGLVLKVWAQNRTVANGHWHWRVKRREDTVDIGTAKTLQEARMLCEEAARRHFSATQKPSRAHDADYHLERAREQFKLAEEISYDRVHHDSGHLILSSKVQHALEAVNDLTNAMIAMRKEKDGRQ